MSPPLGGTLLAARVKPRACAIIGVLLGAASMVWTADLAYSMWTAPLSLCGIWAIIHLYSHGSRLGSTSRLRFLGRSSLVFYLCHFPIMMVLSKALLPVTPIVAVVIINLLTAIAVGIGLALVKNAVPVSWLFRWPDPRWRAVTEHLRRRSNSRTHRTQVTVRPWSDR